MAKTYFTSVIVSRVELNGQLSPKCENPVTLSVEYDPQGFSMKLGREFKGKIEELFEYPVHRTTECARIGTTSYIFNFDCESICLRFNSEQDLKLFHAHVHEAKVGKGNSVFSERTEDTSAEQYFQFYGYLSQQQNMLQDYVRTGTYQRAVLANSKDFQDKVVLDVGAGSGILSFFAVQAGAKRVYAVEASSMVQHAEVLVAANKLQDRIRVIAGKIEEIELPETVDLIISEPMGYMLYNERMIESFLHARKWLKPGGLMFPTRGDLHVAPFTDDQLFSEQTQKANFWYQNYFHGVDLSSLRDAAFKEYFRQPVVDIFDIRSCLAKSVRHTVDFSRADETDLHRIEIPLEFFMLESGTVHGLGFWFDVVFIGSSQTVWLSTAPMETLTHWYQVRCLFETPLFTKAGQLLRGKVVLQANQKQSYDVEMDLCVEGGDQRATNTLDLKNPHFRYTGQTTAAQPTAASETPSEGYWAQFDGQYGTPALNLVNGLSVNGITEMQVDSQNQGNILRIVSPPNIHPGSISSTGRQRHGAAGALGAPGGLTGTAAAQLIGGGIAPTLFSSTNGQPM